MFVFCRKMNELNKGIIECWDLASNPKATELSPQFGTKGEWWSRLLLFNVLQLTQASFLQKIKHCKMIFFYISNAEIAKCLQKLVM